MQLVKHHMQGTTLSCHRGGKALRDGVCLAQRSGENMTRQGPRMHLNSCRQKPNLLHADPKVDSRCVMSPV